MHLLLTYQIYICSIFLPITVPNKIGRSSDSFPVKSANISFFFASQSSRREFSVITFASGRLAPAPCARCSRNMENRNIRSNCLIAVPGMCPVCSVFPQSVAHLASICIGQQQSLSTSTRGTPVIVLWGTTFHCTRVCCPSAPHIDSFW